LRPHAQVSGASRLARLNDRNRLALIKRRLSESGNTKDPPRAKPANTLNGVFPIPIVNLISFFVMPSDLSAA
jgi:hypothetical protein